MKKEQEENKYRDGFAKLPKLKSKANYDEHGNMTSISVEESDKPLYTEEQQTRFEIPRFLWKRVE